MAEEQNTHVIEDEEEEEEDEEEEEEEDEEKDCCMPSEHVWNTFLMDDPNGSERFIYMMECLICDAMAEVE